MPDTDVAEKVGAKAAPEQPTDPMVAQPEDADAPADGTEATEPTATALPPLAPKKPSREEQLERELRIARGDQAKMRLELNALRAQGDPVARIAIARMKAEASGEDPDVAERRVSEEATKEQAKTWQAEAQADILQALKDAGMTVDDWNSGENEKLLNVSQRWEMAFQLSNRKILDQLAAEVRRMKKVSPAPVMKTREQRAAELALADTGGGSGGAGKSLASYKESLKNGKALPTAEEIDRLVASHMNAR